MAASRHGSLQILHLFAELLDHTLHLKTNVGQFEIVRLGATGIDLTVEFLRQEIEPPSHRSALADHFAGLRNMRGDPIQFFARLSISSMRCERICPSVTPSRWRISTRFASACSNAAAAAAFAALSSASSLSGS